MGSQRHRGKHPEDERLFSNEQYEKLKRAVQDLSYLYSRNYSEKIAVKVVGDHYQLTDRQRLAIQRASCGDESLKQRRSSEIVDEIRLKGGILLLDGYNLLITVESLLSDGVLIRGRDGCVRDIASIHGTYHKVEETIPALKWIGNNLQVYLPSEVRWYLDSPISNSKRLAGLMREISNENGWNWSVEVVANPDNLLINEKGIVISSDSWILDRVKQWWNFVYRCILKERRPLLLLDFFENT